MGSKVRKDGSVWLHRILSAARLQLRSQKILSMCGSGYASMPNLLPGYFAEMEIAGLVCYNCLCFVSWGRTNLGEFIW